MEIRKAVFVKSSEQLKDNPKPDRPEYAFIGRSNVGKSSLINMLCSKKDLARVSATPGKTITFNHYLINDAWFLVDLPGYGYAKRSKEKREQWEKNMKHYFSKRENLMCVFVLVDARLQPQEIDIEFVNFLGELEVPFNIIFTKTDKNSQGETAKTTKAFKEELLKSWEELPEIFLTSAIEKKGKKELLAYIDAANKNFTKPTF